MMKVHFWLLICLGVVGTYCQGEFEEYLDNPYRELGLPPWSTIKDIKKRYNTLVKDFHPDKNKTKSKEKFMRVQKAYEHLKSIRKDDIFDNEEEDSFFDFLKDTIQTVLAIVVGFLVIYWGFYFTIKYFYFIWMFLMYMTVSFFVVDRLIPHYFNTKEEQYTVSFVVGLLLNFRSTLLALINKIKF